MDLDEVLRCLAEADQDQRRPELCGGRYLAVAYGEGLSLDISHLRTEGEEEFSVRGGAASFYDALELLVDDILRATGDTAEELLDRLDDAGPANDDGAPLIEIVSPRRRFLAFILSGFGGPMDVITEQFEEDAYLGDVLAVVSDSRFVLLASAAPPNQEFALGVLELGCGGPMPDPAAAAVQS